MEVRLFGRARTVAGGCLSFARKQRALLAGWPAAGAAGQRRPADRSVWGDRRRRTPNALQETGQLRRTFGPASSTPRPAMPWPPDPGVDVVLSSSCGGRTAAGQRRRAGAAWPRCEAPPAPGRAAGRVHLCRLFDAERAHLDERPWWRSIPADATWDLRLQGVGRVRRCRSPTAGRSAVGADRLPPLQRQPAAGLAAWRGTAQHPQPPLRARRTPTSMTSTVRPSPG